MIILVKDMLMNAYGRPNRTKALAEGVWGITRMVGCGNTMMSDGLVARMVWIGCEDGWDRLRGLCGMLSPWPIRTAGLKRLTGRGLAAKSSAISVKGSRGMGIGCRNPAGVGVEHLLLAQEVHDLM